MKLSLAVAVLGCVAVISAMPFQKRQFQVPPQDLLAQAQPGQAQPGQAQPGQAQLGQAQPGQPPKQIQDVDILQFALSLENLEFEFYKQGLDKFSEADFRRENVPNPTQTFQNLHHIKQHEEAHVATLQKVIQSLGGQPVPPCEYQFPFQTARQFLGVANALEKVGVSAYNGALAIMQDPDLQTAAATIDTIEARHASFLQSANGGDPFPENFDVALDAREVTTLATPFIKKCSFDLGFVPFGPLQVKNQIHLPESDVECAFQQQQAGGQLFCNWLFSDQSIVVPLNGNLCKIPPGARGDIYLAITNDQTPLSLKKTDTIVAGPAIVTVDTAHTDSCKELFSGKKLPEPKLNQPMDHGAIPMHDPNAPAQMSVPPPVGVPPPPPSPELVTSVPPPPANTVIDIPAQDPGIQSLFAETQACANPPPAATGIPPPPTIPSPTDLANGIPPPPAIPPPSLTPPQLTTSVPPPSTEAPPAYGSPPPMQDNIGGVPPAYGGAPPQQPPLQDNIGTAPPAYGGVPPPVDPNAAYGAPPVDPNAAYGAPPVDPNAAPPTDPNAPLPLDLTTPTDPNAPADPNALPVDPNALPVDPNAPLVDPNAPPAGPATNSLNAEPVISGVDNLNAPESGDQSEFPDLQSPA